MTKPPENDFDVLLKKYAPLVQLAGLFFIWQESKRTEEKIPLWAKWERFLLPAMIVIALGFIFKDMPETMGEIKDAIVMQNDRILVIETKLGDINSDLEEIKSNVSQNRSSLYTATSDRFTGKQGIDLENRMRSHSDNADTVIIDRVEDITNKLIQRISDSEERLDTRIERLESKRRNP